MARYLAHARRSVAGRVEHRMPATDIQEHELHAFFAYVVRVLEQLNIPYMVVGGFAATIYGEPA